MYRTQNLASQFVRLKKLTNILKATEGFLALNPKQQQMIVCSLYFQLKSERYIEGPMAIYFEPQKGDPYYFSKHLVKHWFCHAAIIALETEDFNQKYLTDVPEWFSKSHVSPKENLNHNEISRIIKETGFPCVLQVAVKDLDGYFLCHSALGLGLDSTGEIIFWEKESSCLPFQLRTLTSLLNYYSTHYWGARKLNQGPF